VDTLTLVAASAANLAAWHDTNLAALGYTTCHVDGLWLTPDRVPPIFFSAIAIRPGARPETAAIEVQRGARVAISDPWGDLELGPLGWAWIGDYPWMVRPPDGGTVGDARGVPAELRVEPVHDARSLDDFERVSGVGFGSPRPRRFAWHAPEVLRDGRLAFWMGTVDGRPVAGSMSFACAGVVGIYGVSTVPEARRRGYATALTIAAMSADPTLPAVLQPSEAAESLYRRLGFRRFASFRAWARAERST
jgi:GNAT superfamily N-acetyltransferase